MGDGKLKSEMTLPMVEIFETIEGEGTRAGYPTTFIRLYHCNLRCTWCDTKYSYAPAKPRFTSTITEIIEKVREFNHPHVCLTGGEPLIHGDRSMYLIQSLSELDWIEDIHIETNGAIDLVPFVQFRQMHSHAHKKVRFILDYKLPTSGEQERMIHSNFDLLTEDDEIKFVIASEEDYEVAKEVVQTHYKKGVILFSPVWGKIEPSQLVHYMLRDQLKKIKLNLQLHKIIWGPDVEGV